MIKKDTATASLLYIHIILLGLKRYGVDRRKFLHDQGIDYDALREDDVRLPVTSLNELWKQAQLQTRNSTLGLDCGMHVHPSDYGIMSHVWMNCPTLGDAFQLVTEYKHLMNEAFACDLIKLPDNTSIYSLELMDIDPQEGSAVIEFDFASILHMGRFLANRANQDNVQFQTVHFKHKPNAPLDVYRRCFGCEVLFEQDENRIFCPESTLSLTVHSPNDGLRKTMLRMVDKLVSSELGEQTPILSGKVTTYLKQQLGQGLPDAEVAAQNFGYSLSTFKRHLQREGASYQELCNDVRKSVARQMLLRPETNICEIAFFLGFSNVSAFHRAFKRWYSTTPNQYRQRHILNTRTAEQG